MMDDINKLASVGMVSETGSSADGAGYSTTPAISSSTSVRLGSVHVVARDLVAEQEAALFHIYSDSECPDCNYQDAAGSLENTFVIQDANDIVASLVNSLTYSLMVDMQHRIFEIENKLAAVSASLHGMIPTPASASPFSPYSPTICCPAPLSVDEFLVRLHVVKLKSQLSAFKTHFRGMLGALQDAAHGLDDDSYCAEAALADCCLDVLEACSTHVQVPVMRSEVSLRVWVAQWGTDDCAGA